MRLTQAEALLAAVREYGGQQALRLSAAVVDARGHEVASVRMDGATWFTPGVARTKAATAVSFGRPSAELADLRAAHPEVLRLAGEQLPFTPTDLPGGFPVYDPDGLLLGGIGASGGRPEGDVAAALAAVAACGLRTTPAAAPR